MQAGAQSVHHLPQFVACCLFMTAKNEAPHFVSLLSLHFGGSSLATEV